MTSTFLPQNGPAPLTLLPYTHNDGGPPFDGDILERKDLADKLKRFLPRLSGGAVIAIDAPWGAGKTWFGLNWAQQLRDDGHKVAFINAFEQDYTEDPFLPIAAEISALLEGDGVHSLLKKAATVGGALLPVAAKAAVGFAARWALGGIDVSEEYSNALEKVEERSEEFTKHWVERKLETHKKEAESLNGFRKALGDAASTEEKPVVVFVDELDRCRPDFAVRLIERIKHFFETPNVVFVLLINRQQLQNAVQGVYGAGTDGVAYLSKFVHFFFSLPVLKMRNYISTVMNRFGLSLEDPDTDEFAVRLEYWQIVADLTLRDIERACALFAYARLKNAPGLLAYLVTLKIKRPDLYARLLNDDWKAHQEAAEWCAQLRTHHAMDDLVNKEAVYFTTVHDLHLIHINRASEHPQFKLEMFGKNGNFNPRTKIYSTYLREVDLPIM